MSPARVLRRTVSLALNLLFPAACISGSMAASERGTVAKHPAGAQPKLEWLRINGFESSLVSVPPPSAKAKPLLVVAHGAGDRPEWQCDLWKDLVGARGFVLCLAGRRTDYRSGAEQSGYYYPDHHWLGRAMAASLAALRVEQGRRLDEHDAVFVGYSQGAIMGALLLGSAPRQFASLLLVEGGGREWTLKRAQSFKAQGGHRVVLACGTHDCSMAAKRAHELFVRAGVPAHRIEVPGAGHTYGGAMRAALPAALEWLVASDPRWR